MNTLKEFARLFLVRLLARPKPAKVRRDYALCIVKTDRIGDLILASGVIRLLLKEFGDANTLLVVSQFNREIAEREFPNTPKLTLPAFGDRVFPDLLISWARLRPIVSGFRFKHLVCLRHQRTFYQDLLLSWFVSQITYGVQGQNLYGPLNAMSRSSFTFDRHTNYPTESPHGLCLELEAHRKLYELLPIAHAASSNLMPVLRRLTSSRANYLLISPASSTKIKDYPSDRLVNSLLSIYHYLACPMLICVPPSEIDTAQMLALKMKDAGIHCVDINETRTILEFVSAIEQARAVLTMDWLWVI